MPITSEHLNLALAITGIILSVLAMVWGFANQNSANKLNNDTTSKLSKIERTSDMTQADVQRIVQDTYTRLFGLLERGGLAQPIKVTADMKEGVQNEKSALLHSILLKTYDKLSVDEIEALFYYSLLTEEHMTDLKNKLDSKHKK